MRILLLNPNTTEAVTRFIAAEAAAAAPPGIETAAMTAPFGHAFISTRPEAAVGADAVLAMLQHCPADTAAAVIAGFADPGLFEARSQAPFPVVGLGEAAMFGACLLGRRFALVSFEGPHVEVLEDVVDLHGLRDRYAGLHLAPAPQAGAAVDVATVRDRSAPAIARAVRQAAEAGADVAILAGGPLAGLARRLRPDAPLPVIDGVAAAVEFATVAARLRYAQGTGSISG